MSVRRTLSDLLRDTHLGPSAHAHLARAVANMGVRYPSVASTAFIAAPPASGAETVAFTTPPLTLPLDGAQVLLWWYILVNVGTGTTSAQVGIRRGTTTAGQLINARGAFGVTASAVTNMNGCFIDTPGAVAGQQYSVTLQGTATTGAWGATEGCLIALAL